ncbi:DUF3068 domain-containing protein [Streptacidiphilus jiangxiensis]|uniref:DUF3068 domain-containing protein n=1 Tax=Streptacidiphilus jiangxiensis TaxID=235985 RepID=A0A1H7N6H0_STRJI|nr:DUF3068 domain-containing protein [Streptacidiphilus jiangxiensis]SEL18901.1 Protein of unknown function [Streptacidiphilus jiangxiensis]
MSHRVRAAVLLATGALLAAAGPVLHFAVLPAVRVAPWDPDSTTVSTGQGHYLDPTTGAPGIGLVTATQHIQGDPVLGKREHLAVWTITTRVDTPTTQNLTDARQALSYTVDRWTFDRVTNLYVACCGADTGRGADAYLKFPFNADASEYQLWDPEAGQAFPAQLVGTRELDGHTFNAYVQTVPPTRIGTVSVPPGVLGVASKAPTVQAEEWYQNPQTLTLVDQETGTPVSQTSHEIITLRMPGQPTRTATALDVTLRTNQDTEQQLVNQASGQATGLRLLGGDVPWLLTGVGVLLALFAGIGLRRRATSTGPDAQEPSPTGGEQPAVTEGA